MRIGGEVWSARAFDPAQILEPGTQVQVAEIEGATALAWAKRGGFDAITRALRQRGAKD